MQEIKLFGGAAAKVFNWKVGKITNAAKGCKVRRQKNVFSIIKITNHSNKKLNYQTDIFLLEFFFVKMR